MNEPKFYVNDIIYKQVDLNTILFGKICKNAEDLTDEDILKTEVDDGLKINSTEKNHAMISWIPSGKKQLVHKNKLILYDRHLRVGDIVRRAGENSQLGTCIDIKRIVCLRILNTNKIIVNINVNDLLPPLPIDIGELMYYKGNIGTIKSVEREILVRNRDKSEFVIREKQLSEIVAVCERLENDLLDPNFLYMNQMIVVNAAVLAKCIKRRRNTKEIKGLLDEKKSNIIMQIRSIKVIAAELGSICGYGLFGKVVNVRLNKFIQQKEVDKLCKLNKFYTVENHIGAYAHYQRKITDIMQYLKDWTVIINGNLTRIFNIRTEINPLINGPFWETIFPKNIITESTTEQNQIGISIEDQENPAKRKRSIENNEPTKRQKLTLNASEITRIFPLRTYCQAILAVEVVLSCTTTTVLWQDGTKEFKLSSSELTPMPYFDDNEYFPGEYVIENSLSRDENIYGYVKKYNHKERMVLISWICYHFTEFGDVKWEKLKEEIVSVYDIIKHVFSAFKIGTTVLRAHKNEKHDILACLGKIIEVENCYGFWVKWKDEQVELMPPMTLCNYHTKITEAVPDLDLLKNEYSCVFPLRAIVENPLEEFSKIIDFFSSHPLIRNAHEFFKLFDYGTYCNNFENLLHKCFKIYADRYEDKWKTFWKVLITTDKQKAQLVYGSLCHPLLDSKPKAEVNSTIEEILNDHDKYFTWKNEATEGHVKDIPFKCHKLCATFNQKLDNYGGTEMNISAFLNSLTAQMKELLTADVKESSYSFEIANSEIFVLLSNAPETHRYKNNIFCHSSSFATIIQKELINDEMSLLTGILIKGFADRIDLFSVLIKGPKNTPYEGGLFLFDVQFPQNYPDSPPNVFYLSYCTNKLNPNLCNDGKVLLSLLGTRVDERTDGWNPSQSNLCLLLVSIQELVFVSEPYYNQPGYEKQVGTFQSTENCRLYNEMAVLKTIDSMLLMMRQPADTFKTEILKHFKTVCPGMLSRYETYLGLSSAIKSSATMHNLKFPLSPISKGFFISLNKRLNQIESSVSFINLAE